MEQQKTETRSITAEQRKRVEEVCFRSLALIGRNCEYLEQHFDRTGADASTRQAVADIDTAAMQLDRTLSEVITLLEFLHEDTKPQLYPIDLCELLQQVAAQSDMIRAQLGVDIRLDYGGRRQRWKTAAAFWAGRSWDCCSAGSAAAGWTGAYSWSLRPKKAHRLWCAFRCTRAKAAPMARWSCAPVRRPSGSSASIICVPCWCGRCAPCRSAATRTRSFNKVARPLHSVLCGGLTILRPVLSCKRKAWYTEC